MTKAELIVKMCAVCGESKATAERVLDGLCGVIETELKNGGAVTLPGIGKLFSKMDKARECHNPRTGEIVMVPARRRAAFAASKNLKDILRGE